jgi:hypothetical protein
MPDGSRAYSLVLCLSMATSGAFSFARSRQPGKAAGGSSEWVAIERSDFGIEPCCGFLRTTTVRDELRVKFDLFMATPASKGSGQTTTVNRGP